MVRPRPTGYVGVQTSGLGGTPPWCYISRAVKHSVLEGSKHLIELPLSCVSGVPDGLIADGSSKEERLSLEACPFAVAPTVCRLVISARPAGADARAAIPPKLTTSVHANPEE